MRRVSLAEFERRHLHLHAEPGEVGLDDRGHGNARLTVRRDDEGELDAPALAVMEFFALRRAPPCEARFGKQGACPGRVKLDARQVGGRPGAVAR